MGAGMGEEDKRHLRMGFWRGRRGEREREKVG